jgi:hypothetical protein
MLTKLSFPARLWRWLQPPHGCQVRRAIAWTLIAYGMVRVLQLPAAGHEALTMLPWFAYGWAKIVIGVLLLVTNGKYRINWSGRVVAAIAFALCVTLAIDSYPIFNGVVTYTLLALFTIMEVASRNDCIV